jgi:hypothetical protein
VEVDLLVFETAPQSLDKDVVHAAARNLSAGDGTKNGLSPPNKELALRGSTAGNPILRSYNPMYGCAVENHLTLRRSLYSGRCEIRSRCPAIVWLGCPARAV